ncbi:hypothetical protein LLE49_24255 [Alicyclobacillus tolerans]|uniref:HVO_0234 family beta-propeller protein n=1 Tax=Alicyclobacillus tolerans TaxID=90970 RepID=UPI001F41B3F2|nr:hypothetical protein [Alicyclobacillus tolerans]MCF8567838.1 hypothetical protein [Alicyclobacillus tolerans]
MVKRIAAILLTGASTFIMTACGPSIPNLNGTWTLKNTSDGTSGVLQLKEDKSGTLNGQLSANNETASLSGVVNNKSHVNITFNENGNSYKFVGNVANGSIVGTIDGSTWEATRTSIKQTGLETKQTSSKSTTPASVKWTNLHFHATGSALLAMARVNNTLFVGTDGMGLFSLSSGVWSQISPSHEVSGYERNINCLLNVNDILYIGTDYGVYMYTNHDFKLVGRSPYLSGKTKTSSSKIDSLAIMGNVLYAGTQAGIYSYQNGEWTIVGSSPKDAELSNINGVLYASADNVYAYQNGEWKQVGSDLSNQGPGRVVMFNGVLYVATAGNGVYSLTQGSWTPVGSSVDCGLVNFNGTLYGGGSNNGVYSYTNGTWTLMGLPDAGVYDLLSSNGVLYAATNNGVFSTNG